MALTARQIEKQRRDARRDVERDFKRAGREQLKKVRDRLRHANRWRSERRRQVKAACRRGLKIARERAKAIRAEHRARARVAAETEIQALQDESRRACEAQKVQAEEQSRDAIARALRKFDAELHHQHVLKVWGSRPPKTQRKRERLEQSDDEVRNNIPAELVPVWNKLSRKFKDEPRRTRTEAFLEWAAEHTGDVQKIVDVDIEASIAELIRAEARQRRELQGLRRADLRRLPEAELMRQYEAFQGAPEVPF